MSATALGIRLMVRNSFVAYSATPPASTVQAPRYFGLSSSRQLPVVIVALSVTRLTLRAQPLLRSTGVALFETRGVHAAQFLLQVVDLVANPRRQLELQIPCGRHHLIVQILDQIGEFGARHIGRVAALEHPGADRPPRLALRASAAGSVAAGAADLDGLAVVGLPVHLVEDVGDLLAQRLRI